MSMFYFNFLLLTAVYLGIEITTNICGRHHYKKRYIEVYGPQCHNLIMLPSLTYMFLLYYFSDIRVN